MTAAPAQLQRGHAAEETAAEDRGVALGSHEVLPAPIVPMAFPFAGTKVFFLNIELSAPENPEKTILLRRRHNRFVPFFFPIFC
jgi:hypothetical protein